jgi:hypothetical protein
MNSDELDTILDDALASYTLQEPRAGLGARIMARVRAEGPAPRWPWLQFAAAALVLAGLTATVVMWQGDAPPPGPVRVQTAEPQVPNVPVVRAAERPRAVQRDALTPEQRALLMFAQQAPEAARQLAQPDKPLEIEAINIQAIQIDSLEIGEIK